MKIFVPIKNCQEAIIFCEAGADEFYCGLIDEKWEQKYGNILGFNRRSHNGKKANFASIEELQKAINIVHYYNKKIYLTLNNHQFNIIQIQYVFHVLKEFKEIGGDGVIISDPNIINLCNELGFKIVISTDLNIYNSETLQYFYERNIDRVILSRDIKISEILLLRNQFENIEIEVFMLNGGCKFSDSLCYTIHKKGQLPFCKLLSKCDYKYYKYSNNELANDELNKILINNYFYHNMFFTQACGICAIWRLIAYKIDSCKLVGRILPTEKLYRQIKIIKTNISIAKQCNTEKEYLKNMVNPYSNNGCKEGYKCYYPEITVNSDFNNN